MQLDLAGQGPEKAKENHARIQAAMQPGRSLALVGSGPVYIDDTLRMPSGSSLRMDEGLTLTAAPHMNKPLLRNSTPDLGNHDIGIQGGAIDYNGDQQSPKGGTLDTMATIFQNVRNLQISHVRGLNARKYIFLAAGCRDVSFSNIEFDTPSDGIHIQGPAHNVTIRNITGRTGDDMIAFTIGDYEGYELSRGDITGVLVENVEPRGSKSAVKLAGNPGFLFQNIVLRKITGYVRDFILICLVDRNLNETRIEDVSVQDLDVAIVTDRPAIFVGHGTHIRDLSIAGARFRAEGVDACGSVFHFNPAARVERLTLRDIDFVGKGQLRTGRVRANFSKVVLEGVRLRDMVGHLIVEQLGADACEFSSSGYSFNDEPSELTLIEGPVQK